MNIIIIKQDTPILVKIIIINPGLSDCANENSNAKSFSNSAANKGRRGTSVISTVSSVIGGSYDVGYETADEGRRLTRDGFFRSG